MLFISKVNMKNKTFAYSLFKKVCPVVTFLAETGG